MKEVATKMENYLNVCIKICLFLCLLLPMSSTVNLSDYMDKVEMNERDWINLRDLYRTEWPKKNIVSYYILDNFISWVKQEPDFKHLHVYSLNGDWRDGTFALIVSIAM